MAFLRSTRLPTAVFCSQPLRTSSISHQRTSSLWNLRSTRYNSTNAARSTVHYSRTNPPVITDHTTTFRAKGKRLVPAHIRALDLTTSTHDASSSRTFPAYTPPTAGLLSYLPKSVVPYAELIRLDKPTGTYYLYFPCLFSTLIAATMTTPVAAPSVLVCTAALFFTGALVMRGAGCTINDLWDRNLDPHVERTRLRPIARRAITPKAAIIFTSGQLLTGLAVLLSFPFECFWYATPSLLFVATYPLAKRVTNYPQFVLGLTFSWGAMMGFPALGVDLLANQAALAAATCLYASNVAWTVLYDMIYAHMDIKDDAKAGIKSIALRHDKETKAVLTGLAVVQLGLLAAAGVAAGMGPVFFIGSCGSAALTLSTMIWRVNLKEVKNCWWWFKNGAWFTGGGIALGLTGEYLTQLFGWYGDDEKTKDECAHTSN